MKKLKAEMQMIIWIVLVFFAVIPALATTSYMTTGFDKVKWIVNMIQIPNHVFWFFIIITFVLSILVTAYCFVKAGQAISPKPKISKEELRDMVMNGDLN